MHIWRDTPLSIILALHHGTLQPVLKVTNLLLCGISGHLIRDLALIGALFDLLFPPVFAGSGISSRWIEDIRMESDAILQLNAP
jgi:hypothetical protein